MNKKDLARYLRKRVKQPGNHTGLILNAAKMRHAEDKTKPDHRALRVTLFTAPHKDVADALADDLEAMN